MIPAHKIPEGTDSAAPHLAVEKREGATSDVLAARVSELSKQNELLRAQKRELERVLAGVERSRSWRLTAPLRGVAKLAKLLLPLVRGRRVSMSVEPRNAIERRGDHFEIVGSNPIAALKAQGGAPPPSGWVRVRGRLHSPQDHHFFFLYYSSSEPGSDSADPAFDGLQRAWFGFDTTGAGEFLVRLPERVTGLRLDPFEIRGSFRFEGLEFQELGSVELALAIIKRQLRGFWSNPGILLHKARKLFAVMREGGLTALRVKLFADNFTSNYQEWVRRFDTLDESDRRAIREDIGRLNHRPLISIVMPVFNSPEEWLTRAIESVKAQLYPHWELCIADDASTAPHVKPLLECFARDDARIKVAFRGENGHICRCSQSALELATGEFVALLDHDDELTEHALYMVAREINDYPEADLIYSDEDKITSYGMRFNPHFKSDWNPELFLSQNFICHLGVYRTEVVQRVGGFRTGYEGAQDWDLAWRVIDTVPAAHIRHIPHVLYHWRVIEGSTAQSTGAKPYVMEAQQKTVRDHLERTGEGRAAVSIQHDISQLKVEFPIPEPSPLVSLIIPTKDQLDFLKRDIASILEKTSYKNFEILVVDNGSAEERTLRYFDEIERDNRVRVLHDRRPFNFSALNNGAVREARGELVGFLNNDLEVISEGWLTEMVSHAVRRGVGAVGARLWYPNHSLQHAGVIVGIGGIAGHNHKGRPRGDPGYFNRTILTQNLSAVTAACLVMRRAVFDEVGGFDEEGLSVAFNDVDLCLKIRRAGYRIIYTPYAELFHHESISRGYETTPEKFQRFEREIATMRARWTHELANDPYYNPNLTVLTEDFTFAFPPRAKRPWRDER